MKNRFTSMLLAMAMCLSLCVPAFATYEVPETNAIHATPVVASAVIESIDGTTQAVDVYVSTKMLSAPERAQLSSAGIRASGGKMYATTVSASFAVSDEGIVSLTTDDDKSDTNSKNENHVTAYGTIYWRDNWGPKNEFLGASGGWDPDINPATGKRAKLSERYVVLKGQSNARDYVDKPYRPRSNSFEIPASDFTYVRSTYTLATYVTVDGQYRLSLRVCTSPFT